MKLRLSVLVTTFLIVVGVIYFAGSFGFDDDFEKILYQVNDFAEEGGVYTVFLFIFSYVLFTAFVFWVPVWLMSVMGGFLFGLLPGIIYSVIGLMLGTVVSFQIVRYVEMGFLVNFISKKTSKFQKFFYSIKKDNFVVVLALRLIHFVPFRGFNYGAGLTKVSFDDFFLGTFLGILPAVVFYVYLGESLINFETTDVSLVIIFAFIFSFLIFWQRYSIKCWQSKMKKEIFKSKVKN